jgi:uncharacterized protein (DUF58 family)
MRRSPKLVLYSVLAAVFFLLALVLGRPELAALGAPFALVLVVGLSLPRPGAVEVSLVLQRKRAFEDEEIEAELVLRQVATTTTTRAATRPHARIPALYIGLLLPQGLRMAAGNTTLVLALEHGADDSTGGAERRIPICLAGDRWGGYRLGDAVWRTTDAAGLAVRDARIRGAAPCRVYPQIERLRSLIAPSEAQPFAGNRVARVRGEGIEFAETRPYVAGDRPRRVNWRATSLRQTLYVNEQHPERNSDVVIFLDTFAEAKRADESTLDLAVRAAATLAEHYLSTRDRVGLVSFGGMVSWLTPGTGDVQRYRMIEALLQTEVAFSFAWRGIDTLPFRSLTPQALVIALTPLLDERGTRALLDLRRRGFDLVVVEMSPLAFAAGDADSLDALATRFWRIWRDSVRFRFEELGVAVVQWDSQVPLAAAIEEVRAFRRFARIVSG